MTLTCLSCARPYEVPEGGDPARIACPGCGTLQGSLFTYAKSARFESVESPAYARACDAARRGDRGAAFAALSELAGYEEFEHAAADPVFAPLRSDPRWIEFVRRKK